MQINNSPTDPAVVSETLRRSISIADELGKKFFCVTFDLAMAKLALKIQAADSINDRLFIHLGSFHILMAFLKVIGKFINGSGLINLLVDCGI